MGSSHCGSVEMNLTSIYEDPGSIPGLVWLWPRPAATAPIRSLAQEPSYASGATLKRQTKLKNKK